MTKLELLNVFLNDRLTAAAEEIFGAIKDTVVEYQSEILRSKEENERLKRLLNVAVQRLLLQPGEEQQLLTVLLVIDMHSMSHQTSFKIYPFLTGLCSRNHGIVLTSACVISILCIVMNGRGQ